MLADCNYDKTKLLTEMSKLAHFLKNQAIKDAKKEGHLLCEKMYEEIYNSLENEMAKLKKAVAGLAKEDKF